MKSGYLLALWLATSLSSAASINKAHSVIENMLDKDRNKLFSTYIKNSGDACGSVTRNFFQGFDSHTNAFWNISCNSNDSYVIMIRNDSKGSTQVMSCALLKAIKAGECFKKF